jgi:hypothetical protein
MAQHGCDVRFVPKADSCTAAINDQELALDLDRAVM